MSPEIAPAASVPIGPDPAGAAAEAVTRTCDPRTDPVWADLAERSGTLFHSASWMRVLADAYGLRPQAVLVVRPGPGGRGELADGQAVAGMAWVEVADPRGRRLVSLPFSDMAGPIGAMGCRELVPLLERDRSRSSPLTARLRPASTDGPDRGAVDAVDRARFEADLGLAESGRLAWHWTRLDPVVADVDVGTDADPQWAGLASGARQNIRRSRRSAIRIEVRADGDALDEYHRLHRRLRREKYRLLAQPPAYFTALQRHFGPERLRVVLARLGDDPRGAAVAGVVLLRHGDHAYYKLNASTPEGWSARANDAVMWEAMTQARRWGCDWFDFGVSDLDQPGLIRYKDKYATGRGEVVVLGRPGSARPWTARQLDRVLPLVTRAVTAGGCPDVVGRQAGRLLYRWFC
jgi:CelD/BcsL family acetyltransferase involved in cellulose biosynthesis